MFTRKILNSKIFIYSCTGWKWANFNQNKIISSFSSWGYTCNIVWQGLGTSQTPHHIHLISNITFYNQSIWRITDVSSHIVGFITSHHTPITHTFESEMVKLGLKPIIIHPCRWFDIMSGTFPQLFSWVVFSWQWKFTVHWYKLTGINTLILTCNDWY